MISPADYLFFVDRALDAMAATVEELGDDLANRHLDVPGANSPYAILTHCLGVVEYWGGHAVAGRPVARDREAEFTARGPVAELVGRTRQVRDRFAGEVEGAEPDQPLRGALPAGWESRRDPFVQRQGAALVHVYEELAQHLGQMEVTRDVLRAAWAHRG